MKLDLGKPTSEMNGEKGQVDILPLKNNKIIIFTAVTELSMISLKFLMWPSLILHNSWDPISQHSGRKMALAEQPP